MTGSCVTAPSVVTGTPRAPKATGAVSKIKVKTRASKAGKPRAISRALVMATGEPKPATPSSRQPRQKPITTSTIRRSSGRWSMIQQRKASKRAAFLGDIEQDQGVEHDPHHRPKGRTKG